MVSGRAHAHMPSTRASCPSIRSTIYYEFLGIFTVKKLFYYYISKGFLLIIKKIQYNFVLIISYKECIKNLFIFLQSSFLTIIKEYYCRLFLVIYYHNSLRDPAFLLTKITILFISGTREPTR